VRNTGPGKEIGSRLLALSSAAVLAVYAAGYVRTRAAADRFAEQTEARVRPMMEAPRAAAPPAVFEPAAPTPAILPAAPKRATEKKRRKPSAFALRATADTPAEPNAPPEPKEPKEPEPVERAEPKEPLEPKATWKDGTYFGWGTSRHGDIQAQVVVEAGRIASATISQCLTRYSCSVIATLPPQVAQRQSPETDYISGATQSTNAFYYAVVEALSKAK
jgi:uncharacterized protein with FMN-binding domain